MLTFRLEEVNNANDFLDRDPRDRGNAVGVYWLVARAKGEEPKSEILDESIDAKRSHGERVDV